MSVPVPLVDLGHRDTAKAIRDLTHLLASPAWLFNELLLEVVYLSGSENLVLDLFLALKARQMLGQEIQVVVCSTISRLNVL